MIISMCKRLDNPKLYRVYYNIISRCNNKNSQRYHRYGGRGITCDWESYENFLYDMKDSYYKHVKKYGEKETTIQRVDNDGNYNKQNCIWDTWENQYKNRGGGSCSKPMLKVNINGKTYHIRDLVILSGIKRHTILKRIYAGDKGMDILRPLHRGSKCL